MTVLLTGATGLVGRFLLAGLLRRNIPTIVLVRSQSRRSAAARIDEALAPFESNNLLPRPVVLEADLTNPDLGLSPASLTLLRSIPLRIMHSAASIRFQADSPSDEPFATNVNGTRNLLELACRLHVTQFHHVSTAYVQCDRNHDRATNVRRAFEVPVPIDSPAGNDYERSKIQSERLIQDCAHVGTQTFYRPSIVVGDSQTGYTSTYHGFYAPLQIAASVARALGVDVAVADEFRRHLGLTSNDSKNLVPVDWLAAAILQLFETPPAWGGIYHLTHPQPARLDDMQRAIIDALAESLPTKSTPTSTAQAARWEALNPAVFRQQMSVYESYFQDDPPFDRSHADGFLANLPCPAMNYTALKELAKWAIAHNFGWPKPPPPQSPNHYLKLAASRNGTVGRVAGELRDIMLDLEVLGSTGQLLGLSGLQSFCREGGAWRLNPELSSYTAPGPWRLIVTQQSLQSALTEQTVPEALLAEGRWMMRGAWPVDWSEILRDLLAHLSIGDVEKLV